MNLNKSLEQLQLVNNWVSMVTPFRYTFIQYSSAEFEMQTQLAYPSNFRASTYFYIPQRKHYKVFDNIVASCTLGSGCGRGASIDVVISVMSSLSLSTWFISYGLDQFTLASFYEARTVVLALVQLDQFQQAIVGFEKRHQSSHSSSKYLSKSTLKILIFKKMSS